MKNYVYGLDDEGKQVLNVGMPRFSDNTRLQALVRESASSIVPAATLTQEMVTMESALRAINHVSESTGANRASEGVQMLEAAKIA